MTFDPYYQWLGIPPEEHPPHHYRLLGIKPLEENLDVIETAADRQMLHLRTYQSGKHAEASQSLLNEISAAKIELLDPAKKQAYDVVLKAKLTAVTQMEGAKAQHERPLAQPMTPHPAPPPSTPLAPRPLPLASSVAATNEVSFARPSVQRASSMTTRRRSNSSLMLVAGGAVAILLLAVVAAIALSTANDDELVAQDPSMNTGVESTSSGSSSGVNNRNKPPAAIPPQDHRPTSNPPERIADPFDQPAKEPIALVVEPKPPQAEPPKTEPPQGLPDPRPEQPAKLSVPERAAREAKRREILAIFPIDNARTPEVKHQLAAKLIAPPRAAVIPTPPRSSRCSTSPANKRPKRAISNWRSRRSTCSPTNSTSTPTRCASLRSSKRQRRPCRRP